MTHDTGNMWILTRHNSFWIPDPRTIYLLRARVRLYCCWYHCFKTHTLSLSHTHTHTHAHTGIVVSSLFADTRHLSFIVDTRALSSSLICHDSIRCTSWLSHMCAMTQSYVCHDSVICVPWLIQVRAMTHSFVCHDAYVCVSWPIHMCAMTHSYVCHDPFICVPCLTQVL